MQNAIVNYLNWTGNYGNRINVEGRLINKSTTTVSGAIFEDKKRIKSSTKKGTADIDCLINKKPVKLEVKIGKDYQKEHQKKEEDRIKKAGGYYFIVKTMDDFYKIYDEMFAETTLF